MHEDDAPRELTPPPPPAPRPARQSARRPPPATDIPVGEILRRARAHYGQSLEDMERALNIRARQLEALERGEWGALPAPVYTIGFVRAAADYLRLDSDQVVALFKAQAAEAAQPRCDLNFPEPARESALPAWWMVTAGLAAAVGIVVVWTLVRGPSRTVILADIPSPPAVEAPTEAEAAAAPEPEPAQAAMPEPPPLPPEDIVLTVTADSWVEIRDKQGHALVARVLKSGERYRVPSRPDMVVTLGNAGGVRLSVGGAELQPLGGAGEIVRDVPLSAPGLLETYGP